MAPRFSEYQGPNGGRFWIDQDGNKVEEHIGPRGGRYLVDQDGNKIEERIGPNGGRYWVDQDGNKVEERTGPHGRHYWFDNHGNKAVEETSLFGGRVVDTGDGPGFFPRRAEEKPPAPPPTTQRAWPSSASSSGDDGVSGIIVAVVLLVVVLFVIAFVITFALFIGLPILSGVLLARAVDRRMIQPVPERLRWRWALLPLVFTSAALPVHELGAATFGLVSCWDSSSATCASYRLDPAPSLLGIHRRMVQTSPAANGRNVQRPSPPQPSPALPQQRGASGAGRSGVLTARQRDAQIQLRSGPGRGYPAQGYGLVNDRVELLSTQTGTDGMSWSRVRFPGSGAQGWIRGDFIIEAGENAAARRPAPAQSANPPARALQRAEAVALIERWLAAKPRVFAPPFDVAALDGLVAEGPLRHDITKPEGSVDWLRSNRSAYTYGQGRVVSVEADQLAARSPSLTVVLEQPTSLRSPKGTRAEEARGRWTYTFTQQNGRWLISDVRRG